MKLTKKIFSVFLAAAMLLSIAVVPATAADSDFEIKDGVLMKYSGSSGDIVIPDGVRKVISLAFNEFHTRNITSITFPDSVTELGSGVFMSSKVTSVTFPKNVKIIPDYSCYDCKNLEQVTIPNGAERIMTMAFQYCPKLKTLYIPDSVKTIEKKIFSSDMDITIYGSAGSAAETYAKENNIPFVVSDGSNQPSVPETPTTPTKPTPSVTGCSAWAEAYISSAIRKNIVPEWLQNAYTDDITRAEMCQLIMRLLRQTEVEIPTTVENPFKDGMTFVLQNGVLTTNSDVLYAAQMGIVNGVSPTSFNPSGKITREQAATMLTRLAKVTELSTGQQVNFADQGSFSSWAVEGIQFVSGLKDPTTGEPVMGGTSSTAFSPKGHFTREQAITTMLRLANCLGIQ